MTRTILVALVFALTTFTQAPAAAQQPYPNRPITLVVPFPAGGGNDALARLVAERMSKPLGQQVVVENRGGAGGTIATRQVAKAEPDGYTLLVGSPAEVALNQNLFKDRSFDPLVDLTPVTLLAWTPLVLAAHPSFEASTPAELVALARARQIDYSTPGIGSSHHLTGEYINKLNATNLIHVPYRGAGPAVADAVGGQVKLTISGMPPVVGFLQSRALKAIAVASRQRSPRFPDVPALAETRGFEEFDFTNWFGLLARAGTPAIVLQRLHRTTIEALKDAQVREILMAQAAEPVGNTPAEFREFIRAEIAKYGDVWPLYKMVTPGITAPAESATVPEIWPVTLWQFKVGSVANKDKATVTKVANFFIFPP
jgi:tripartite-type tricarboxylate transporter receptor subunit TctC